MRSTFRRLASCFACFAALAVVAPQAHAGLYDLGFTVDPGTSLSLNINPPLMSAQTKSIAVSGTLDATLDTDLDTLTITNAELDASDTAFNFSGFLVGLALTIDDMRFGWTSGALTISGTNVNVGGSTIAIDQGVLIAIGSGLASSVNETIDFSVDPIEFDVPDPTNATINIVDPALPDVTLSVPISVVQALETDVGDVVVTLTGTLNFSAQTSILVPEPSSLAVMAVGMAAVLPLVRRRLRLRKRQL